MSYDFPAGPTEGQEFTPPSGTPTYVWKAPRWMVKGLPPTTGATGPQGPIGVPGPAIATTDDPPGAPQNGQMWYETDSGNTFIFFNDGTSSQWVQQNVGQSDWNSITNKPSVYPPAYHTQDWSTITGKPATYPPDGHSHTALVNNGWWWDLSTTGANTTTGTIYATGNIQTANDMISGFAFSGSSSAVALSATWGGSVYLRPNGRNEVTGQMIVDNTGTVSMAGALSVNGASLWCAGYGSINGDLYIGSSAVINGGSAVNTDGVTINNGFIDTSRATTSSSGHHRFFNTAQVGAITTAGSATTYSTSSSEHLKDSIDTYDAQTAIDIIRADPVMNWNWKSDGEPGVGWIAQKSIQVSPDLATHVPPSAGAKDETTEEWWGIDYGRRTPYLWAALTAALDRIDQLEARLAALEAPDV